MKEEKKEVPRLNGKEFKLFSFLLPGGRGVSSPWGWGWFRPLPGGTRQARKKGKLGPKGGRRKEK